MIRDELKQLKTGPGDLRKFGLTVGGVFALLAVVFWLRHKPFFPYLLLPAAPLLALGLVWPRGLKGVYLGWMALAFVLGHIVSSVLLGLFFYLVVTPIGLLARSVGKDFLSRKWDRQATSYWLPRDPSVPKTKADYEQQF
jgi:glucose-6-phosphate-specific signal transduction histidine kinase